MGAVGGLDHALRNATARATAFSGYSLFAIRHSPFPRSPLRRLRRPCGQRL